ncbi:chemotaxis protein CheW [Myxococcaceae bacterium GXIMD 01537]
MSEPRLDLLPRPPRASGPEAPRDPPVQLCAFMVGREEYVVDIMRVVEILPPQLVTPIPRAPALVEGVLHLRGAILPVVDLRKRLLGSDVPETPRSRLLVCLLGRRRVAVRVDRVTEVVRALRSELKPAPPLVAGGQAPFVVGVWGPPERPRLLLDLKALLRADLEREAARMGGLR